MTLKQSYLKNGKTPKVGIIGAGTMASYHVEGFRQAGADVLAIADLKASVVEAFARNHNISNYCSSLEEMLSLCPDLDAVSVVTPNHTHKPLIIDALQKGLNVFCEKPPALNAGEVQEILDVWRDSGKLLMFDFNNRARAEARGISGYLENQEIGTVNSAQATWIRRNGIPGFGGWFTDKKFSGGGPVIDLLHMIDLSLYFMDYPEPDYVLACTYDDFMGNPAFKGPWGIPDTTNGTTDVESACHGFITFKTGQCLSVRMSWAEMNEREVVSVVFQGTKAGGKMERLFAVDGVDETSTDSCCLYTVENGMQVNRNVVIPQDSSMGRIACAMNFIDALVGKAAPLNVPDQALTLMRIIDAIYASARERKAIQIT